MPAKPPTAPSAVQRLSRPFDEENVAPSRVATVAIRELAERQHGVVAWRQLIDLGLGKDLIHERLKSGRLVRIHRGVFAVGHGLISQRGRWLAAVLAAGPGAVLSYGSAAALWGFHRSRGPIEVTRVSGHRRPHGIRVHQTRWLPSEHVQVEAGIPVTSSERTLLDHAERLDARQLERALVDADRSGCVRWGVLEQLVEEANGRRGRKVMRRLIHEVSPIAVDARSPTEVDFLALCREASLPLPHVNVLVEGSLVDFYWPSSRLVIETDSWGFHGDRRAFEHDHETTLKLTLAGYKVLRATHRMLEHNPAPFLDLVRRSLSR
jgi:predicted transcriptional regulator of viral defense system